jgi:hypothetical protein
MKTQSILLVAAAALLLSACATSTAYAPAGFNGQRGGYAEQRLETDRYRVSFAGNSVTSREQVEMGLLLRAADRDVRYQAFPDALYRPYSPFWGPSWRYFGPRGWSRWDDPFWGRNDFDVREIDRFEATAEIVLGRGTKPAGDANAFDAREVISNLSERVTRPM